MSATQIPCMCFYPIVHCGNISLIVRVWHVASGNIHVGLSREWDQHDFIIIQTSYFAVRGVALCSDDPNLMKCSKQNQSQHPSAAAAWMKEPHHPFVPILCHALTTLQLNLLSLTTLWLNLLSLTAICFYISTVVWKVGGGTPHLGASTKTKEAQPPPLIIRGLI